MSGYNQRVRDSILPMSVGDSLPSAFGEWTFTDRTIDHEKPIETCELVVSRIYATISKSPMNTPMRTFGSDHTVSCSSMLRLSRTAAD